MNKRELTTLIAERTGLKKKDVHATLQATIDCISEAIQAGERVTFMGFGSFYTQERGPRMSYNVYTKERRHLDTRKVIKFKSTLPKQEMQQLESDMEKLNTEKTTLETALNSGALDTEELVKSSQRIAEIIDLLDEKEMRWLELSEIE